MATPSNLPTTPATNLDSYAQALSHALTEGWPESDLVRLLAQAVEDFDRLGHDDDRARFLAEPRLTGNPVWDAALAALAVHLTRRARLPRVPTWTQAENRYVTRLHWIGLAEDSTLQAFVYQRTPAYFKARGVMLNEANLESV